MEETREILGVGQSRPPEVLDHPEGWERGPVTGVRRPELSDGDDGGIPEWCVGFESALIRLFGFAGEVYAGNVGLPLDGGADSGVAAPQQGLPVMVDEPSFAGHGNQAILRAEQWMIATEPETFGLYVALVVRVVASDGLPIELEVATDAVGAFELAVGLFDLLEKGMVIPCGAVVDGGCVGGGTHRHEVAVELVWGDVLGLVDFEEETGGVAEDVAGGVGAEEELAGAANGEEVAVLEFIIDTATPKGVLEARDADLGLGVEGRGGLDGAAAVMGGSGEQDGLKPGGEFVLAALTGDHDGKG